MQRFERAFVSRIFLCTLFCSSLFGCESESQIERTVLASQATKNRTAEISHPKSNVRRLTRTEYRNTVRDLLHLKFEENDDPTQALPPDPVIDGFDKRAAALMLDGALLNEYLQAAIEIADRAIVTSDLTQPPVPTERLRFEFEDIPLHPYEVTTRPWAELKENGLVLMSGSAGSKRGLRRNQREPMIPISGRYTIRVRAAADRGVRDERALLRVWRPEVGQTLHETYVDAPLDAPQTYEITLPLNPEGADSLVVIFVNGTNFGQANLLHMEMNAAVEQALAAGNPRRAAQLRAQMRAEGVIATSRPNPATLSTAELPRLFLDWIEIEGPLYETWPPRSHQTVFFAGDAGTNDVAYARQIFRRLLPKAYRRPVNDAEIEEIIQVVTKELEEGEPFTEAVKTGLITMFCSPHFLLIADQLDQGSERLNDFELAERLSYFLWSSQPDNKLFELARTGTLREPRILLSQTRRMLDDVKVDALTTDFACQWLKVDEVDRFAPDVELYPVYARPENARLDDDLQAEMLGYFREMLRGNHSIAHFLDSDWTVLNERLARFYQIDGVSGNAFRKVALPSDSPRGGLLGMAGFHRWGSDGNRTKPVHRGVYLLDVLLNDRPPLPPLDVGEVEPNPPGENLSVRDRLAAHRQIPGCAECHQKIDAYGLALENFNAIGQWRDTQDGEIRNWAARGGAPPIDASGELPDGSKYKDFREFKQLLCEQEERFVQPLAEKLFAYALARRLESRDTRSIQAAVKHAEQHGRTLRALIEGIVQSEAFQSH
ncbi:hypothetical protein Pan241w_53420 [Gimesia alba]|uniref:DUF1592 domain-containing protein n=1 Tax=Gimesia alba TaxID=2527973 RepID=A0A517RMW8_9PLAN|nr:DUF1592 domain-containing protein [Gimesia alba]QDT45223.1 hypothetical protein Pan241w_53420 [Gimesia alba]